MDTQDAGAPVPEAPRADQPEVQRSLAGAVLSQLDNVIKGAEFAAGVLAVDRLAKRHPPAPPSSGTPEPGPEPGPPQQGE
jgi:hypothetical protein